MTLPLGGSHVTVRGEDEVILSLRTKDPTLAKARFSEAEQALSRHWESLRRGPVPLTHRQLVALAGDCYRANVAAYEADPEFMPDGYLRAARMFEADVAAWRNDPLDDLGDIGEVEAVILATLALPRGPQILAYQRGCDVDERDVTVSYDAAVADLFGAEADETCRARHLELDPATRMRLVREIATAYRLLDRKLLRNASGDYSPDQNASRFPQFVPPPTTPNGESLGRPRARTPGFGIQGLFDRWREAYGPSVAASTVRRYAPSVASLEAFTKGKDVRLLRQDDVWDWAKHRLMEGCSARTVNRNDLVAVVSILNWAMGRDGGRLRADNPAKAVRLPVPKVRIVREKTFRAAEVTRILTLAKAVEPDRRYPKASASRRWAPWICAYSGARIQEVLHLAQDHIWCEGGIWVMQFSMTKDGHARTIPLHEHLVAEGLLEFWKASGPGPLFMGDKPAKEGATRSAQEMRASEIACWIQRNVDLDYGVSPKHGWRHSFATNAEAAGIPKRLNTAITGHNKKRDAADGYITPSIGQLKEAMDRYPRYQVGSSR